MKKLYARSNIKTQIYNVIVTFVLLISEAHLSVWVIVCHCRQYSTS